MDLKDVPKQHKSRIKRELIAAGVSKYGLIKMESRYLPEVIHHDEHVKAVAYGLRNNFSGILVATDQRIIYFERKPFYKVMDEVAYTMVSGIRLNARGQRAAVVLHTRIGDYSLRFVNKNAAEKFVRYIDTQHLKQLGQPSKSDNY
ncbi:MAG: PH domain-containing protein [Candidatus Saccharimonadales bacterium]